VPSASAVRHGPPVPAVHRPIITAQRFSACFGNSVVRLDEIRAAGITAEQLRAVIARGLVTRLARGRYSLATVPTATDPWAGREAAVRRHVALMGSVLASQREGTCASHAGAAFVLGLATPDWEVPERVSLIRPGAANDVGPAFRLRGSALQPDDMAEVHGVPVTSIERTGVDLARGRSPADALVALDSAARARISQLTGATGNELRYAVLDTALRAEAARLLDDAYRRCFGWPGTVVVRDVLALVDPASESPLESRSRYRFLRAGLSQLRIGQPVTVGLVTYFVDFLDERRKVIGEADGWGKYGVDLRDQRTAWDLERSRQGDLESDGYRFVRWTSSDAPRHVVDRMHRALNLHE
jgi:very-short-patch-repair endonuclease